MGHDLSQDDSPGLAADREHLADVDYLCGLRNPTLGDPCARWRGGDPDGDHSVEQTGSWTCNPHQGQEHPWEGSPVDSTKTVGSAVLNDRVEAPGATKESGGHGGHGPTRAFEAFVAAVVDSCAARRMLKKSLLAMISHV